MRVHGQVHRFDLGGAASAVFAALRRILAEISKNEFPKTARRMAIIDHALQSLIFKGAPRFVLHGVLDQETLGLHVRGGIEQDAPSRLAVAPRAARLLIVGLDILRHIVMDDIAHVGFVDAHAEGVRRDDDRQPVVEEVLLRRAPFLVRKSRVVTPDGDAALFQQLVDGVGLLARGGVNDAGFVGMRFDIAKQEFVLVFTAPHIEEKIRTVEAADMDVGGAKPQKTDDVVPNLRRRGGGKCAHHRTAGQRRDKRRDGAVAGAEIVPPLG